MELVQSPDTLAVEYQVPFWSEKHWAMIADSMRYMGEIGSRVVHIPLIAETNSGNEQSMVRWIPWSGSGIGSPCDGQRRPGRCSRSRAALATGYDALPASANGSPRHDSALTRVSLAVCAAPSVSCR